MKGLLRPQKDCDLQAESTVLMTYLDPPFLTLDKPFSRLPIMFQQPAEFGLRENIATMDFLWGNAFQLCIQMYLLISFRQPGAASSFALLKFVRAFELQIASRSCVCDVSEWAAFSPKRPGSA